MRSIHFTSDDRERLTEACRTDGVPSRGRETKVISRT